MKVSSILAAIGIVISYPLKAEPYAEYGVIGNGMPLSELESSMDIPDASDVSIPLAPGGVFISTSGDKICTMEIRTKRSVEEVCDFYRSRLTVPEYERVDDMGLDPSEPSCAFYRGGDAIRGVGVWVYENEDPTFVKNGSTRALVSYDVPESGYCD